MQTPIKTWFSAVVSISQTPLAAFGPTGDLLAASAVWQDWFRSSVWPPLDQDQWQRWLSGLCPGEQHELRDIPVRTTGGWRIVHFTGTAADDPAGTPILFVSVAEAVSIADASEQALFYKHVFEQVHMGVAQISPAGRLLRVNDCFAALMGYTADQMVGRVFDMGETDLYHPAPGVPAADQDPRLVRGRRFERLDGIYFWAQETLVPVRSVSGQLLFWIVLLEDQTAHRQLAEELTSARNQAELYLHVADVVLLVLDASGDVIQLNRKGYELMGYESGELTGKNWFLTCVPSAFRHISQAAFARMREDKTLTHIQYENFIQTRDGGLVSVLWHHTMVRDVSGALVCVVSSGTDTTAQREAERKQQATEQLFHQFIDNSLAAAWITDAEGNIEFVSKSFNRIIKGSDVMVGKNIREVCPPEMHEIYLSSTREVAQSREVRTASEPGILPDGSPGTFLVYKFPIESSFGTFSVGGVAIDITDRQRAEARLHASEERFRTMIEHSKDIFILTTPTSLDYVSANVMQILGYTPDEFAATPPELMVHPDDLPMRWGELAAPNAQLLFEYRLRHKQGHWCWIEAFAINLMDDPRVGAISFTLRDISERKMREAEIQQLNQNLEHTVQLRTWALVRSEGLLKEAQRVARLGSWELDVVTNQVTWSEGMFHIMGLVPGAEVPSYPLQKDIFTPASWHLLTAHVTRAVTEGVPYTLDLEIKQPNGTLRTLSAQGQPIQDDTGRVIRLIGTAQDITARKQAEDTIRRQRETFETILEQSLAGYWDWKITEDYEYLSPAFKHMLGYEDHEMAHHPSAWQALIYPEDLEMVTACLEQHIASRGVVPFYAEVRYHHKNGGTVWVICKGTMVEWTPDGAPARMVGCHIDITRQKNTELILEKSRQELEAFSYSVSHDLRAPLRGIDGWSLALQEDFAHMIPSEGLQYLSRVRTETQRMGQLIDDLLKLSRISQTEMRCLPTDLSTLINNVIEHLMAIQPDREITFVIMEDMQAEVDQGLMEVALTNLLSNAIKFTSRTPDARVEVGQMMQEGRLVYFVRDNGVGFSMEGGKSKKLFGPFQRMHRQTEFPGTGIGLATVQRIISRHQGHIWAQAAPGQGATFYFTLNP